MRTAARGTRRQWRGLYADAAHSHYIDSGWICAAMLVGDLVTSIKHHHHRRIIRVHRGDHEDLRTERTHARRSSGCAVAHALAHAHTHTAHGRTRRNPAPVYTLAVLLFIILDVCDVVVVVISPRQRTERTTSITNIRYRLQVENGIPVEQCRYQLILFNFRRSCSLQNILFDQFLPNCYIECRDIYDFVLFFVITDFHVIPCGRFNRTTHS